METTTGKVLKVVINFFITAGWLWVFHRLGWITFTTEMSLVEAVAVTALVSWLVSWLIAMAYALFIMATLGLGCLLLPVVMMAQGWFTLILTADLTGWFSVNEDFWWIGLLMSIVLGLLKIPSASVSTSESSRH